jgi:hypothetical protein
MRSPRGALRGANEILRKKRQQLMIELETASKKIA